MMSAKFVPLVAVAAVFLCCCTFGAAAPYQELEARPGYVPVYIREGDTPLSEINPKLAEAFNEIDSSNLISEGSGNGPDIILMAIGNEGDVLLVNDQVMDEAKPAHVVADSESKAEGIDTPADVVAATESTAEVIDKESSEVPIVVVAPTDDADAKGEQSEAIVVEETNPKTSDIASFDVVKSDTKEEVRDEVKAEQKELVKDEVKVSSVAQPEQKEESSAVEIAQTEMPQHDNVPESSTESN